MKLATAWGGFVGFLIATVAGVIAGREPVMLLLDACLACLVGAWLLQWLHRTLVQNVRTAIATQHEHAEATISPPGADKAQPGKT